MKGHAKGGMHHQMNHQGLVKYAAKGASKKEHAKLHASLGNHLNPNKADGNKGAGKGQNYMPIMRGAEKG